MPIHRPGIDSLVSSRNRHDVTSPPLAAADCPGHRGRLVDRLDPVSVRCWLAADRDGSRRNDELRHGGLWRLPATARG